MASIREQDEKILMANMNMQKYSANAEMYLNTYEFLERQPKAPHQTLISYRFHCCETALTVLA